MRLGGTVVGTFELEADNHRGETPQDSHTPNGENRAVLTFE